ncbi:MAG: hydantoinase/oxoprolinase family protein [Deltaproteobacteria bacterium]|nr:hydantoinase/oxoprolinase family protein [Deltaproteobacteria bacterium]
MMDQYRVTVDTGGTFTDMAFFNDRTGELDVTKVPSTPDDPSKAILAGLQSLLARGVSAKDVTFFSHGTTVGTNALLEEKGVRTGLLVTEGFAGIYPVGEQARPYGPPVFDVLYEKPKPFVRRWRTEEIPERVGYDGNVIKALEPALAVEAVRALKAKGVESIAVCLLFSFLNPAHEQIIKAIIQKEMPDCAISLSSEVLPQIREYYRLSTTVINAYIQPILKRYIETLHKKLCKTGLTTKQLYIMQSNGGVTTFQTAAQRSATTVLSGPAGGVIASIGIAKEAGFQDIIAFDMGGTSCDVSLVKDGAPSMQFRGKINGRDIALPMIDIHTVSAGGGTIARLDPLLGSLEVGPQSAGAVPGPVCYDLGGENLTVTDADLIIGFLNPRSLLGGEMKLNRERAYTALKEKIAAPLGLTAEEAADGIIRIINVKMEEAIKAVSTMRGFDLRDFTLIAFGGAGPVHAGKLAQDLGIPRVLIPPFPGITSAMGLLMADVKHDYVRSKLGALRDTDPDEAQAIFDSLEDFARTDLAEEGFSEEMIRLERFLDLRYEGQGYELTMPVPMVALSRDSLSRLRKDFDVAHKQLFGHEAPGQGVEIVTYRLAGYGLVPRVPFATYETDSGQLELSPGFRRIYSGDEKRFHDCPVYQRESLGPGSTLKGPAIVEQMDSTTVIYPGQTMRVDSYKNMILENSSRG